MVDKLATV